MEHYVFEPKIKTWHARKKGISIGRMYHCNLLAGEKSYLRFLTVVRGSQSFEHLCTIDGVVYDTF